MRNTLVVGAALVAVCLWSSVFARGVAARDRAEWTDPAMPVALESPSSSVGAGVGEALGNVSIAAAQPSGEENDDLVTMALATFGVAVAAAVAGLVAYLVRVRLGLVAPPPSPPEEGHGSH